MSNDYAIKINIDTDQDEMKQNFDEIFKKDLEKAVRAVCLKHCIDYYNITVDPVITL